MIIRPNFKNSRKAEKAIALLALSADKGAKPGRCLNPEEMAALVDSQCTKEELAIYMQHLSRCEQCYGEWLSLKTMDKMATSSAAGGRTRPVSRLKKYGFIGSAMAVAASVVIFFNINQLPRMVQETEDSSAPAEAVLEKSQESSAIQQFNHPTDTLNKARTIAPVEQDFDSQIKELSAPLPQAAAGAAKKSEQAELSGRVSAQRDVDSWLKKLQKNCLSGRQEAEFWTSMAVEGQTILDKQAGFLPANKRDKLTAALALLHGMGTKPVTDQCRQLLALLAEQQKSR